MNPALYQILESYYRKRRLALIITIALCSVVAVIGLGLLVASLVDGPDCPRRLRYYSACVDRFYREVTSRTVVLTGLPGITAIICAFFLYPLRDLSQAPLLRLFTARKDDVAWIYAKRTSVRKYGIEVNQIHEVVVGTVEGKRLQITMTEADVKKTIALMVEEAPRAAVGFDDRIEAQFARNPAGVQQPVAAPTLRAGTAPGARLVLAPDCAFPLIDQGLRYLGFTPEGAPAPAAIPGEVTQAVWSGKGMRLAYSFDPTVYLRVLEIQGGDPTQLRGELSSVVNVPVVGPQQIAGMLASYDPRSILLGLRAAEASSAAPAERAAYQDIIARLQQHPDPSIAQTAQRVAQSFA